jgi:hypothetical protein
MNLETCSVAKKTEKKEENNIVVVVGCVEIVENSEINAISIGFLLCWLLKHC